MLFDFSSHVKIEKSSLSDLLQQFILNTPGKAVMVPIQAIVVQWDYSKEQRENAWTISYTAIFFLSYEIKTCYVNFSRLKSFPVFLVNWPFLLISWIENSRLLHKVCVGTKRDR